MVRRRKLRLGLALGGGAARGWSHIGVLRALEQAGVRPDVVCGTSIGALVGAAYAAGELDRFQQWVLEMGIGEIVGLLDFTLSGGLIKGERLLQFLRHHFADRPIESLSLPFAAVATQLATGSEVWLRDGDVLIDGGLVNPVPVSLARAMGAEVVIAVDLNSDLIGRHLPRAAGAGKPADAAGRGETQELLRRLQERIEEFLPASWTQDEAFAPSLMEVIASSVNIMQVRITRSRMAGDPPEVLVAPRLAHLGLLDFHRGREAIEEGRRSVAPVLPQLRELGLADQP